MGCFWRLVVLTIQEEKLVLLLWELDLIPLECALLLITAIDKCISALIMVSVGVWYKPYGNAQSSRLPFIGVIFGVFYAFHILIVAVVMKKSWISCLVRGQLLTMVNKYK